MCTHGCVDVAVTFNGYFLPLVQDFYNWPDESFEEMDSTLAVQQVCCPVLKMSSRVTRTPEPPKPSQKAS